MLDDINKISDNKIFSSESEAVILKLNKELWPPFKKSGFVGAGFETVREVFQTAWLKNFYGLIFIIKRGRYSLRLSDQFLECGPANILIIPPDTYRQIRMLDDYGEHYYLHISEISRWPGFFGNVPETRTLSNPEKFFGFTDLFFSEVNDLNGENEMIAVRLAEVFLLYLQKESNLNLSAAEISHLAKMKQLWREVEARPEYKWTIACMSRKVGLSGGHFHVLCKKFFGCSPLEKVIRTRMTKACSLLRFTDDSLDDIAETVGYKSAYSFSRLFKDNIGVRPGTFRQLVDTK